MQYKYCAVTQVTGTSGHSLGGIHFNLEFVGMAEWKSQSWETPLWRLCGFEYYPALQTNLELHMEHVQPEEQKGPGRP